MAAKIRREHFVFSIGFNGGEMIVNKKLAKKFGKLSVSQLLEKELYRAALCGAMFDKDEKGMSLVCKACATAFGIPITNHKNLLQLFGVDPLEEEIQKIVLI